MRRLASELAKAEGKKSSVKIGDVREIIALIRKRIRDEAKIERVDTVNLLLAGRMAVILMPKSLKADAKK